MSPCWGHLSARFEWQPDLEGVKTFRRWQSFLQLKFEWQPDLEGVKTWQEPPKQESNAV